MGELERRGARDLITYAAERGSLSPDSSAALTRPEVSTEVQRALEGSYSIKRAGRLLLVTMMPDDSGSMQGTKRHSVIAGHNELLAAMADGKEAKRTMLQTRYLNGRTLNPFSPLVKCQQLTLENYPCILGTPLLFQTLVTLGAVMAKAEELAERGARVRTATLIMTDAGSTEENQATLKLEVASVVRDMRRVGEHIVAGMGFVAARNDEAYRRVFTEMGIDPQYIFTATSRDEILQAFSDFTRSVLELTAGERREGEAFEG